MKKLLFNPKMSKAEQLYQKQIAKRPYETIFSAIARKVQDYLNKPNRQGE